MPVLTDNIPEALKTGKRFLAWRFEERQGQPKPAKMPYSPAMERPQDGASTTNPAHWTTFDKALAYARAAGLDGSGRIFDHSDGMVGIDLDNCRDPETGELTPEAAERVRRADTYTEISPSGTGVKMWMYATMPDFGHKKGDVEIYGSVAGKTGPCGRFFTMTGQHLEGTPRTVGYRPDFVLALHREVFGEAPDPAEVTVDLDRPVPALQLGDEDVIRLASESAHNGERFRKLWSGDTSGYAVDGNAGNSEALAALVELVVYYGGPDPERVDRLVRRSGLYTEKWERPDIRRRAFDLAMRGRTRFHGDSVRATPPAPISSDGVAVCACDACPAVARVAYLERALLDRDDLVEFQQSVIKRERTERQELTDTIRGMCDVMALPKAHMAPPVKLLAITTLLEAHSRTSRGITRLSSKTLEERTGLTPNMISAGMQDLAAREGSPIKRRLTREWRRDNDGQEHPVTISEVIPLHDSIRESFAAVLTMGGPSARDEQRRKADRERTEANQAWGRCGRHDNDTVAVKGYCPDCGEIVGERIMRREDFAALNPGIRETEAADPPVVVRTSGSGFRETDTQPVSLLDYVATRADDPLPTGGTVSGPRCGATKRSGRPCASTMYRDQGGGRLHCLGCGSQTAVAVKGASE